MKPGAAFVVGIDLGTSHTVVAWGAVSGGAPELLPLPQLVGPGEVAARPLLASCLYTPVEAEGLADLDGSRRWIVGELARRRGADVPGRLVASSKSWLSHGAVDRTAPLLPWGAAEDVPRVSPVEAAAALLRRVRRAWEETHPGAPLAGQEVVLTVPASFDEVARELTVRAAEEAGLSVTLLEEPQAAFYGWLARHGEVGLQSLLSRHGEGARVLVVDIGGGTTDLSLLALRGASAAAAVERVAVGPHVLLGGDNMDLALAHHAEAQITSGRGEGRLDPARFGQLVLACRGAKEQLLAADAPGEVRVSVAGSGSRLFGNTASATLTRDAVEGLLTSGFFPVVPRDAQPTRGRSALVAFGLPYERDAAVTKHIAAFLARHVPAGERVHAVLANGGVFRAPAVGALLAKQLEAWFGPVEVLDGDDPELAVARGAVAHGLARRGHGPRVGGGAPRSYFVGVAAEADGAARAVCVVPRGAPEGAPQRAESTSLELQVGTPVRFDLYTSDAAPPPGTVMPVDETFAAAPAIAVSFEAGARPLRLRVLLEGTLTEVGTLDLHLVERAPPPGREPRRFRLAFQLGDGARESAAPAPSRSSAPPARLPEAVEGLVDVAFPRAALDASAASIRAVKDLARELERLLGDRKGWTVEQSRALFDLLAPRARVRRLSPDHERVFWMLAGFALRPGFGAPGDRGRCRALYALLLEKVVFGDQARTWAQFWIAFRRVAGGLEEGEQATLRDVADPFLAPAEAGLKASKKWKPLAQDELRELAASLERVPAVRRADLGDWLVQKTFTDRDGRLWPAIGRVGARVPAYGGLEGVVPPARVEPWIERLLREDLTRPPLRAVAVALARRTDDRGRDVPEALRARVASKLEAAGARADETRPLREVQEVSSVAREAFYGEGLPPGLRLLSSGG